MKNTIKLNQGESITVEPKDGTVHVTIKFGVLSIVRQLTLHQAMALEFALEQAATVIDIEQDRLASLQTAETD